MDSDGRGGPHLPLALASSLALTGCGWLFDGAPAWTPDANAVDGAAPEAAADAVGHASPGPEEPPPPRIVELALGDATTCVRRDDGRVQCRGKRGLPPTRIDGDLTADDLRVCGRGDGHVRCIRGGVEEGEPTAFVEVARGAGGPAGRDADGSVWLFFGAREDGATVRALPLDAPALRVVADAHRACAWLVGGALVCWDPYVAMHTTPPLTTVASGVTAVDATYLQTCWTTADGAWCREAGRPRRVVGVARPRGLAVGRKHGCALDNDAGDVLCWRGHDAAARVAVPPGAPIVAIDAGADHTCALRADGDLWCWGADDAGQCTGLWP